MLREQKAIRSHGGFRLSSFADAIHVDGDVVESAEARDVQVGHRNIVTPRPVCADVTVTCCCRPLRQKNAENTGDPE